MLKLVKVWWGIGYLHSKVCSHKLFINFEGKIVTTQLENGRHHTNQGIKVKNPDILYWEEHHFNNVCEDV